MPRVDGANNQVILLSRADCSVRSKFSQRGAMAGQFKRVHIVASDSKGNRYTAEVGRGRQAQKFDRLD